MDMVRDVSAPAEGAVEAPVRHRGVLLEGGKRGSVLGLKGRRGRGPVAVVSIIFGWMGNG